MKERKSSCWKLVLVALLALALMLGACGPESTPTPEPPTEVVVLPTDTSVPPTDTPVPPTDTPVPPTKTPVPPTATLVPPLPTPTWTPTSIPLNTSTPTPSSTATRKPTPKPPTVTATPIPALQVTYQDLHYECTGGTVWSQKRPPYLQEVTGYRSFQTLMVIKNLTTDRTLPPPWMPERWIVTDGKSEWEETYTYQFVTVEMGGEEAEQPPIGPGATASWTFVCFPLPEGAWVKAVEFTAWDHTYHFEFPKPEAGEYNYIDCP